MAAVGLAGQDDALELGVRERPSATTRSGSSGRCAGFGCATAAMAADWTSGVGCATAPGTWTTPGRQGA